MKTAIVVCLVCIGVLALTSVGSAKRTALTDYVYEFDANYHWNVSDHVIRHENYTVYQLYLTSQKWLTAEDTNRPVWRHWLQVCVAKDLNMDMHQAMVYIDGHSYKDFNQPPGSADIVLEKLCQDSKAVTASLWAVPNQPLYFADGKRRTEDSLIAYTWSHFINNTNEPDWLARFPMTKATIKAMDAMQEWSRTRQDVPDVNTFVVGGASKRGWTAWMVGAMGDPRVVGIAPIVAPIANLVPQINEMYEAYGAFSFALEDYEDENIIPNFLNMPVMHKMLDLIDPLSYLEELNKIPKYIISACGDEFFMPDANKYFWPQLGGEKFLRMVPNAEHTMIGHIIDALDGGLQFFFAVADQTVQKPKYDWTISPDGSTITVNTDMHDKLIGVKVWTSHNNSRRDWRLVRCIDSPLCVNPKFFFSQKLEPTSPGSYSYTIAMPPKGYSAFLIELEFDLGFHGTWKMTTDVSIVPKKMPFPHCPPTICECGWECKHNNTRSTRQTDIVDDLQKFMEFIGQA